MNNRRASREWLMQQIYAHLVQNVTLDAEISIPENLDKDYIQRILSGLAEHENEVTNIISEAINISIDKVDLIELATMQLACYEIIYEKNIPIKVSINEATEICKRFGSVMSYKFINGTLDTIAKRAQAL